MPMLANGTWTYISALPKQSKHFVQVLFYLTFDLASEINSGLVSCPKISGMQSGAAYD